MSKRYGVGLSEKKSTTLSVASGLLPVVTVLGISSQARCLSSSHSHLLRAMWRLCWAKMTLSHRVEWPLHAPSEVCFPAFQRLQESLPKRAVDREKQGRLQQYRCQELREKPSGDIQWGRGVTETLRLSSGSVFRSWGSSFRMLKEARPPPTASQRHRLLLSLSCSKRSLTTVSHRFKSILCISLLPGPYRCPNLLSVISTYLGITGE